MPLHSARFHLDKLVDAGLLEVSFARRSGRTGPGAGRPAKLYHLTDAEYAVSVPPRAYRSAAEMLAEAVARAGADQALYDVARERGRAAGAGAARSTTPLAALHAQGYQPVRDGDRLRLANCPFHLLAGQEPGLVCGMNLALVQGMLDGMGLDAWRAAIDPVPGHCCVALSKNNNS